MTLLWYDLVFEQCLQIGSVKIECAVNQLVTEMHWMFRTVVLKVRLDLRVVVLLYRSQMNFGNSCKCYSISIQVHFTEIHKFIKTFILRSKLHVPQIICWSTKKWRCKQTTYCNFTVLLWWRCWFWIEILKFKFASLFFYEKETWSLCILMYFDHYLHTFVYQRILRTKSILAWFFLYLIFRYISFNNLNSLKIKSKECTCLILLVRKMHAKAARSQILWLISIWGKDAFLTKKFSKLWIKSKCELDAILIKPSE